MDNALDCKSENGSSILPLPSKEFWLDSDGEDWYIAHEECSNTNWAREVFCGCDKRMPKELVKKRNFLNNFRDRMG